MNHIIAGLQITACQALPWQVTEDTQVTSG